MAAEKSLPQWLDQLGVTLEDLVERSGIEARLLEAIVAGRYTPSPQQRGPRLQLVLPGAYELSLESPGQKQRQPEPPVPASAAAGSSQQPRQGSLLRQNMLQVEGVEWGSRDSLRGSAAAQQQPDHQPQQAGAGHSLPHPAALADGFGLSPGQV